jgi:hypothetical protein
MLVWSADAVSLLSDLDEDQVRKSVVYLTSVMNSSEFGGFIRELLTRGIEKYQKFIPPDTMKKVILGVAAHGETRWLGILLQKQTTAFFQSVRDAIEDGQPRLVEIYLNEIACQFNENHFSLSEPVLALILNGLEMFDVDVARRIGAKFHEKQWLDVSKRMIAICDAKGMVRVYVSGKNRSLMKGTLVVHDGELVRVLIDPSDTYVLVTAKAKKLFAVKVGIEEESVTVNLIWSQKVEGEWITRWLGPGDARFECRSSPGVEPQTMKWPTS